MNSVEIVILTKLVVVAEVVVVVAVVVVTAVLGSLTLLHHGHGLANTQKVILVYYNVSL